MADQEVPHLLADKLEGTTGEQDRPCNLELQQSERKPQNFWLEKPVEVSVVGETPTLTGEFFRETQKGLECTQNLPSGNQHQKGPN